MELAIDELQQAVRDTPRIHYGCELHLTPEGIADALRAVQVFDRPLHSSLRIKVAVPEINPSSLPI
ncbi:MAG TPA: hypothetical protein VE959_14200 [Bryobacteraceae bacterium]|nr:hypothetical protein [Bryobacteraceae bacterium]